MNMTKGQPDEPETETLCMHLPNGGHVMLRLVKNAQGEWVLPEGAKKFLRSLPDDDHPTDDTAH